MIEKMERETGFEPATSSLGIHPFIGSKSLARFCCEFLNLQPLAESAFFKSISPNEAQTRQGDSLETCGLVVVLGGRHSSPFSLIEKTRVGPARVLKVLPSPVPPSNRH